MFWYALVCFNSKLHTFDARLHRALDDAKPFVLDFHLSQGGIPPASQTWWQYNPCRTHTTIYKYIQPISNQYWEGNQYESVRSISMSFSEKFCGIRTEDFRWFDLQYHSSHSSTRACCLVLQEQSLSGSSSGANCARLLDLGNYAKMWQMWITWIAWIAWMTWMTWIWLETIVKSVGYFADLRETSAVSKEAAMQGRSHE